MGLELGERDSLRNDRFVLNHETSLAFVLDRVVQFTIETLFEAPPIRDMILVQRKSRVAELVRVQQRIVTHLAINGVGNDVCGVILAAVGDDPRDSPLLFGERRCIRALIDRVEDVDDIVDRERAIIVREKRSENVMMRAIVNLRSVCVNSRIERVRQIVA